MEVLILIPLILCIIMGISLYFVKSNKKVLDIMLLSTTAVTFVLSLVLLFANQPLRLGLFSITQDLTILFKIDEIGKIFGALFAFIWFVVSIFSIKYMDHEENVNKFYAYTVLTLSFMIGLAYAGNLLTMYLVFELVTLSSMPLVMHSKTKESKSAALKYLFYSLGGGFLGLIAVVAGIHFSSNFGEFVFGGSLNTISSSALPFVQIALLCGLIGFGAKAGVFPLQAWLPTAHPVAPSPASALLSGVITKAGVIVIIRLVLYTFGYSFMNGTYLQYVWETLLLITILLGSTLALLQKTFKRRLAYSSISQLSYVLLGICSLTEVGFYGSILHVLSHAMIKVGLFLVAGYLIHEFEIHSVDEMEGLGKKSPITMWCYTLFSIALIGVPPTGAFFSKWYLALGSLESGLTFFDYFGAVVLLISAILTAVYLLSISIKAFFPKEKREISKVKEPLLMVVPLIILVVGVFVVGIFSTQIIEIFISSVWEVL